MNRWDFLPIDINYFLEYSRITFRCTIPSKDNNL